MNLHEYAALSANELCRLFRRAMRDKDIPLAQDSLAQLESRFRRLTATVEGSKKFVSEFLVLCGSPEVRALHIDNPLERCAARVEYLLELAGERARGRTEEATLRQIVSSRERGFDLLHSLAKAPAEGLAANDLASTMGLSPQNLSPLIRAFNIYGIIDRSQRGKFAFLKLTETGRRLLPQGDAAHRRPISIRKTLPAPGWDVKAFARRFTVGLEKSGYVSLSAKQGIAAHELRRVQEEQRLRDRLRRVAEKGQGEVEQEAAL